MVSDGSTVRKCKLFPHFLVPSVQSLLCRKMLLTPFMDGDQKASTWGGKLLCLLRGGSGGGGGGGVLGVWAEPSPDCQLTGPDFPVWKSLVSVGEAGCWETGREDCPGLGSLKLNISNRQAPSVFQCHQPTRLTIRSMSSWALSNSGSTHITLEDMVISDVRAVSGRNSTE